MTYWATPWPACSATKSSMKRERATTAARKPLVNLGFMSGRWRHPSSGAAIRRTSSYSSTCGGGSIWTCIARHSATRTAVLSGASGRLSCIGGEVGDDFDAELAGSWAIEFSEEYGLPAAEDEAAVFDPNGLGGTDERGFDVRVGIAFGVLVIAVVRDQAIECCFDVTRDGGIIAFVDDYARGSVWHI